MYFLMTVKPKLLIQTFSFANFAKIIGCLMVISEFRKLSEILLMLGKADELLHEYPWYPYGIHQPYIISLTLALD